MFRAIDRTPLLVAAALLLFGARPAPAQVITDFTVFSASGATPADILPVVNQYRAALGGGSVAGPNGSFSDATGSRREINWDGVPANFAAPNNLPGNFFNTNSPRGVVFSTSGTGFMVSSAPTDAGTVGQPALPNFGNINPTYQTQFQPFSSPRLFTPVGSNVTVGTLFLPGTNSPALTGGFGAVFTDVDTPSAAQIILFGANTSPIGTFSVPASPSGGVSFLGLIAKSGTPIGAFGTVSGTAAIGPFVNDVSNLGSADLVVMDDFFFGEPVSIPEPSSLALVALAAAGFAAWRRKRQPVVLDLIGVMSQALEPAALGSVRAEYLKDPSE